MILKTLENNTRWTCLFFSYSSFFISFFSFPLPTVKISMADAFAIHQRPSVLPLSCHYLQSEIPKFQLLYFIFELQGLNQRPNDGHGGRSIDPNLSRCRSCCGWFWSSVHNFKFCCKFSFSNCPLNLVIVGESGVRPAVTAKSSVCWWGDSPCEIPAAEDVECCRADDAVEEFFGVGHASWRRKDQETLLTILPSVWAAHWIVR